MRRSSSTEQLRREQEDRMRDMRKLIDSLSDPLVPDYIDHCEMMGANPKGVIKDRFQSIAVDHNEPKVDDVRSNEDRLAVLKRNLTRIQEIAEVALDELRSQVRRK